MHLKHSNDRGWTILTQSLFMQESNLVNDLYSLHEMLSVRYVIELHYKAMLQGDSLLLYNIRIIKTHRLHYV